MRGWAKYLLLLGLGFAPPARGDEPLEDASASSEEAFTLDNLSASEDEDDRQAESTVWAALTENLRFSVEVVSRVETTRRRGKAAGFTTLGFDIHKVFTDRRGDIGTLLLQPHIARRDNALPIPHHVEDDDDWEIELHDFYFNLTRWGRGRINFKVGHFDVPYGLEPITDTHLTLYQLIAHDNLGVKKDWGISLNGSFPRFDYELALTQGSGHEYWNVGKNYAVAGHIATPQDQNFVIGASVFYGQVIDPHRLHRWRSGLGRQSRVDRVLGRTPGRGRGDDELVRRTRAGIDLTWAVDQFTTKWEASVGRDFDQDVFNNVVELDWSSADDTVHAYVQGIYLGQRGGAGWDEDVIARLGAVWKITPHFEISSQWSQDLKTYGDRPTDANISIQTRMRF